MGIPLQPGNPKQPDYKTDIPLTRESKIALAYTTQEADSDWSDVIETDHLLRGLLRFPNEASDALNAVGVGLEQVRAAAKQYRRGRASLSGKLRWIARLTWGAFKPALITLGIMTAVGLLIVLILRLINR